LYDCDCPYHGIGAELRRRSLPNTNKPGEPGEDGAPSLSPLMTTTLSNNASSATSPPATGNGDDHNKLTVNAPSPSAPSPGAASLLSRRSSAAPGGPDPVSSPPPASSPTTSVTPSPSSDSLAPPLGRIQSEVGSEDEKKARTRKRVLEEVLSTEKSYVNDLTTLTSVFMMPLTMATKDPDHAPLTKQQINTLFSNVQVCTELVFNHIFCTLF
jgi:hypothetical protein